MNQKRIEELTDSVVDQFETTCMDFPGCGRYDDGNHVRGVRVGSLKKLIDDAIKTAVREHLENEPAVVKMRQIGAKIINECFKNALKRTEGAIAAVCKDDTVSALQELREMKENLELTIVKEWQREA